MNTTVKGHQVRWNENISEIISVDVDLKASQRVGVWLGDGDVSDDDGHPFLVILGVHTPEDAARAYAKHRKEAGHVPPAAIRVFPLASLEPIALSGVVDQDGDGEWSAFSNTWVEVRL